MQPRSDIFDSSPSTGIERHYTTPTRDAAERYELELLLCRSQGDRFVEPSRTLSEEIDAWLKRWKATRKHSPRTAEFNERCSKVWRRFGHLPVSSLRRAAVEDLVADRHSKRLILLAGMVGARQRAWFELTDDLLDLQNAILEIPPELSKNTRAHCVFLTPLEVKLIREQLLVRAAGTPLVFPTPTGQDWNRSGFRERVWVKAVKAALKDEESEAGRPSVFEGFTFHLLRHTACSLMASAGMDPAVAAERAGHTDGGALFLRTYRHLYEAEKRTQALRLEEKILADLATIWTNGEGDAGNRLNEAENGDGRTWDRTRDLSRVKRALSR